MTGDKGSHGVSDKPNMRFQEPPPPKGFGKHIAEHGDRKTCAMCQWARRRFRWMCATTAHSTFQRSWIEVKPPTSGRWGLGCWVCRQASGNPNKGAFGNCEVRRPNKARLIKHRQSARHKRSVQQLLHQRGLAADDGWASLPAPPVEEFANVLLSIRRNELESRKRGERRKKTSMAWCLYEAQREKERKFLAKAVCLSLAQDASTRGPLLLTRYVACGPSLERASGILRVADGKKISGAEDLAKSVLRGIRAMATKRRPHAGMYTPARPVKRLKSLADHIAAITEVFVADGAADEQLAGRMLLDNGTRGTGGQSLPNLRLVVRDKPHSARRLLQRTLPKDPFINNLMSTLLWSRGSLTKLVQYSAHFQDKFRQNQLRLSGGPTVKDLSYAAQRFDSTARPLGRMIDHFDAFLQTAMDIMNERAPSKKEHQSANRALTILCSETMLQLGMVADACEIVVRFIRFVDNERFDTAELPHQVEALRMSATELFKNKGCLVFEGFTKQMVTLIRRPRLVTLSGGRPKTLGDTTGPSQDIVARCLGRMVNWWRLADAVLQTEFPDWDLLLHFQVFRVPRDLLINNHTRDQLLRLSANFGLDPGQVLSEYEDLSPVATQFANQIASATASDVSVKAWQQTIQHVGKAGDKSGLKKLLFRFVAYIGSSSGVEQTFSQCMAQFRHLRNFGMLGVQRVLVLANTRGQSQEEDLALFSRARQIWADNFGAPRHQRRGHIFSGKTLRRFSEQKVRSKTEAAARRRRTLALASLLPQGDKINPNMEIPALRLWGPEQQKELKRQERLLKERKLDAADMGVVRVDPAELDRYRAKQKQTHARYIQKRQAIKNKGRRKNTTIKPGTPTWIGDADWDELMRRTFRSCALRRVPCLATAQAFVVRDVAAPPRMIDLAASLGGGLVASAAHIARPPGPILRYGRALDQRRALWISSGARDRSPKTIDLIRTAVTHATATTTATRWELISHAEFSQRAARGRPDHRRRRELVALVTATEKAGLPAKEKRYCQSLSEFTASCRHFAI